MTAVLLGKSGYADDRGDWERWCRSSRCIRCSIGLRCLPWLSGARSGSAAGRVDGLPVSLRFPSGVAYVLLLAAAFGYLTVLGNKNELFSGLVMGDSSI